MQWKRKGVMMAEHRDLDSAGHNVVRNIARGLAIGLSEEGQSLAIAREVLIKAFDQEAEALDD
jgi:hypothetical protein